MLCAFYQAFYVSSEQDIDGECLMSLTEKQIDALKLSIGHSAKLQKLVTNLNVENVNQPSTIQVGESGATGSLFFLLAPIPLFSNIFGSTKS